MRDSFQKEVELIIERLHTMAQFTERSLARAFKSLYNQDPVAAFAVIGDDKAINAFEIEIDKAVYWTIASGKTGIDELRELLAILKVNTSLERIGDHAVNIAESAQTLAEMHVSHDLFQIREMAESALEMLHKALDAFFEANTQKAEDVIAMDDQIDEKNLRITEEVRRSVMDSEISFETGLEFIRISKNIERIADIASNISEEAVFSVEGKFIKHSSWHSMNTAANAPVSPIEASGVPG